MPLSAAKRERYRTIFDQCDTDNNSLICLKELDDFLRSHPETENLPPDMIRYVHNMADKDGSKTLDFDEFVYLLEHPDWQHVFGKCVNSYVNFLIPRPKRALPMTAEAFAGPRARSAAAVQKDRARVYKPQEDSWYADEYKCCPPPVAMFAISILELVFFMTDEFLVQRKSTSNGAGVTAKVFIYDPARRREFWRYLTYMFVHIGYVHITVNLLVQLILAIPLEMVHKWWRVLLVYFLGVIAGSLATSVADPKVRLAGASGGVYALLTAHIASIIMNWKEMMYPAVQLTIFVVLVCCDTGSAIYDRYFLNVDDQVGFAAHFGGAVAGLLVGIYTLRNLNVTRAEKYVWWVALVLYLALTFVAILVNVLFPSRYPAY